MNKYLLLLFLCIASFCVRAQIIKIVSENSMQSINGAVLSLNGLQVGLSNQQGMVNLDTLPKFETLSIYADGFYPLVIAQKDLERKRFLIFLVEKTIQMDEVVFSVNRLEQLEKKQARQLMSITSSDIEWSNSPTTAELLQQSGGVNVQKSQLGGGSPIIRGFEANRILLVVDGVRMNNAIYRSGHLQNIITLDPNTIKRIEVSYGPGSASYGSDALGGVIYVSTQDPQRSSDSVLFNINAFTRYSSAYQEGTGHLQWNIGWKKFASLTSFNFSRFGDLRQGANLNNEAGDIWLRDFYQARVDGQDTMLVNANPYVQKTSGYKQYNLLQKMVFSPNEYVEHIINIQYSTSSDINRYDRLSELSNGIFRFAEWYYGPQNRLMGAYTLKSSKPSIYFDQFSVTASYQDIEESRHNRSFGKPNLTSRMERVNVWALNMDAVKYLDKCKLKYGLELNTNKVRSEAHEMHINTKIQSPASTRYPDGGSIMNTYATYISNEWELNPQWTLDGGLRFTYVTLQSKFIDHTFYPFPYDEAKQSNQAINGSVGFVFLPTIQNKIALLASSGFRVPNVDDMGKVFDSGPGKVIVPNPKLKPEYVYNLELNLGHIFNKYWEVKASLYHIWMRNAIVLGNFTFNGRDSIEYNGVLSQVQASINARRATVRGLSLNTRIALMKKLSLNALFNYTYGRIQDLDVPLDHIPPIFGKVSLLYLNKKFLSEFFILYNGKKSLKDYNPDGEDNLQYATSDGMPSWYIFSTRISYRFTSSIELQVDLENILDYNYRVFASGISAPGRTLILSLRGRF